MCCAGLPRQLCSELWTALPSRLPQQLPWQLLASHAAPLLGPWWGCLERPPLPSQHPGQLQTHAAAARHVDPSPAVMGMQLPRLRETVMAGSWRGPRRRSCTVSCSRSGIFGAGLPMPQPCMFHPACRVSSVLGSSLDWLLRIAAQPDWCVAVVQCALPSTSCAGCTAPFSTRHTSRRSIWAGDLLKHVQPCNHRSLHLHAGCLAAQPRHHRVQAQALRKRPPPGAAPRSSLCWAQRGPHLHGALASPGPAPGASARLRLPSPGVLHSDSA